MKKQELIKQIQEKGKYWDAIAKSHAVEAVECLSDPEKMISARIYVACARACNSLADEIIELILTALPIEE